MAKIGIGAIVGVAAKILPPGPWRMAAMAAAGIFTFKSMFGSDDVSAAESYDRQPSREDDSFGFGSLVKLVMMLLGIVGVSKMTGIDEKFTSSDTGKSFLGILDMVLGNDPNERGIVAQAANEIANMTPEQRAHLEANPAVLARQLQKAGLSVEGAEKVLGAANELLEKQLDRALDDKPWITLPFSEKRAEKNAAKAAFKSLDIDKNTFSLAFADSAEENKAQTQADIAATQAQSRRAASKSSSLDDTELSTVAAHSTASSRGMTRG